MEWEREKWEGFVVDFAFCAAFSFELLLVFFNDAVCHTSVKDTQIYKAGKSGKSPINV